MEFTIPNQPHSPEENNLASFQMSDWEAMELLLDKEDDKKPIFIWIFSAFLLCTAAFSASFWYFGTKNELFSTKRHQSTTNNLYTLREKNTPLQNIVYLGIKKSENRISNASLQYSQPKNGSIQKAIENVVSTRNTSKKEGLRISKNTSSAAKENSFLPIVKRVEMESSLEKPLKNVIIPDAIITPIIPPKEAENTVVSLQIIAAKQSEKTLENTIPTQNIAENVAQLQGLSLDLLKNKDIDLLNEIPCNSKNYSKGRFKWSVFAGGLYTIDSLNTKLSMPQVGLNLRYYLPSHFVWSIQPNYHVAFWKAEQQDIRTLLKYTNGGATNTGSIVTSQVRDSVIFSSIQRVTTHFISIPLSLGYQYHRNLFQIGVDNTFKISQNVSEIRREKLSILDFSTKTNIIPNNAIYTASLQIGYAWQINHFLQLESKLATPFYYFNSSKAQVSNVENFDSQETMSAVPVEASAPSKFGFAPKNWAFSVGLSYRFK